MKMLIIAILTTSLAGCRSVERALVCNDLEKYSLGTHEVCSYSRTFNKCKCKQVHIDSWTEVTEFQEYPLHHCDDLLGIKAKTWGEEIGPNLRSLNHLKEERCQKR